MNLKNSLLASDSTPLERSEAGFILTLHSHWSLRTREGAAVPPRLVQLLAQVHELGSLQAARKSMGLAYRHAWDMVQNGELVLHEKLLITVRGRGSELTPLAKKLVWAQGRFIQRSGPMMHALQEALRGDLATGVAIVRDQKAGLSALR